MSSCCVPNCYNSSTKKKPGLTFHRFPVDEERRKLWLNAIGRMEWKPCKSNLLCSKHFDPQDIQRRGQCVYITKDAIPKLLEKISEDLSLPVENIEKSFHEKQTQTSAEDVNRYLKQATLLSIENVNLKRKLQKAKEDSRKCQKTMYNMSRVINRQKERINDLTSLVEDFKRCTKE